MALRKFIVLFLLLILVPAPIIFAQQKYADVSVTDKQILFQDSFDSNLNKWITDNSWVKATFESGKMVVTCKNYQQSTGITYIQIPADLTKDYEIEASFKINKGTGALIFGMTNAFDHYRVELTDRNLLTVYKDTPSKKKHDKLLDAQIPQINNKTNFCKITIRIFGKSIYLFVNELFIGSVDKIEIVGDNVGLSASLNSEISVDFLNVSYLKYKVNPELAERVSGVVNNETVKPDKNQSENKTNIGVFALGINGEPAIKWTSPSALRTNFDLYTARVKANVKSNQELVSVDFYVNGSSRGEAERSIISGESGNYLIEKSIDLEPGENIVYFTVTNSKGTTKSDPRYFIIPEAAKPAIIWNNPSLPNVIVSSDLLSIQACINSPSGLKSVKVMVNGESLGDDKVFQVNNGTDCNIKFQRSIVLRENFDNSIYIIAENSAGTSTSENRVVRYSKAIAEKRIALVIGNAKYGSKAPLKNPVTDANLMEASLRSLDFKVFKYTDLGLDSMETVIRQFSKVMREYNVVLFYYAGHGVQVAGQNYLLPIDARLEKKEDCSLEAYSINRLMEEFEKYPKNINIAILDACRSNPFITWARGENSGFVPISNTNGTIISYATAPGSTAADGDTRNGLFTEELVKQIDTPQTIESVFKNTRIKVYERSNGAQRPQYTNDLNGEFYFKK